MSEVTTTQDLPVWNSSNSIQKINFEHRPILEDISIVIPTLGRPILEQCLYWIAAATAWPGCLIVVEQGANPQVAAWLQYIQSIGIPVKHILSDQRGRSAGVNRGIEQVQTRFFAVTDDDCFVDIDWLKNMSRDLHTHPDMIVTGRVEAAGDDVLLVVTSTTPAVYHRPRLKFDSMSGGNMGTSIAVVKRIGLFDEDPSVKTAEDAEWGYRALRAGVSTKYAPDVCVQHFGWRELARRTELYRQYALSHGGFYGKYLRKGDFFILFRAIIHFLRALRRWVGGILSGNTDMALLGRAYFLNLPLGIATGFKSASHREKNQ